MAKKKKISPCPRDFDSSGDILLNHKGEPEPTISGEEIIAGSILYEEDLSTAGVYFLLLAGEIVYVGQAINCMDRIKHHRNKYKNRKPRQEYWPSEDELPKEFDSYYILPTKSLHETERYYIRKFKPRYNRQLYHKHKLGTGLHYHNSYLLHK